MNSYRHPRMRWLWNLGLLSLLWGTFTGWEPGAWLLGAPAVLFASWLSLHWWPPGESAIQLWRLPGFGIWFIYHSLRGGWDVAWRALRPSMPLNPGFVSYRLMLEAGPPRYFLLNCLSLLPGTLSAELEGDDLILHVLDTESDVLAETREAERRVRALYDLAEAVSHG